MGESDSYQRILDVAEGLFMERGYASVRLRDIAEAVGIKHAALYYHAPRGKEQLYVDVMRRSMQRHRLHMEAAIEEAGPVLRDQLRAVGRWLLSQPPVNLARMEHSDFPALDPERAYQLSELTFESLRLPVERALERAGAAGEVNVTNAGLGAIAFVSLVQSVHASAAPYLAAIKGELVEELIDMLLFGWLTR